MITFDDIYNEADNVFAELRDVQHIQIQSLDVLMHYRKALSLSENLLTALRDTIVAEEKAND